jgi:hypothetical protein
MRELVGDRASRPTATPVFFFYKKNIVLLIKKTLLFILSISIQQLNLFDFTTKLLFVVSHKISKKSQNPKRKNQFTSRK